MDALLKPRFMAWVRINPPMGGGGEHLVCVSYVVVILHDLKGLLFTRTLNRKSRIATVLTVNDNHVKMKFYEIKIWTKMRLTAFTIWLVNSLVSAASRLSYTGLYCRENVKRISTLFTGGSGK